MLRVFHMLSFDPSNSFEKLLLICMFGLRFELQGFILTTLLRYQLTGSCAPVTSMLKVKNVGRDDCGKAWILESGSPEFESQIFAQRNLSMLFTMLFTMCKLF